MFVPCSFPSGTNGGGASCYSFSAVDIRNALSLITTCPVEALEWSHAHLSHVVVCDNVGVQM